MNDQSGISSGEPQAKCASKAVEVGTAQGEQDKLTFDQIEDAFPESNPVFKDPYGDYQVSAQWLHQFARNIAALSRPNATVQGERELFEQAAKAHIAANPDDWPLIGGHDDEEKWAWWGWQARASRQAVPSDLKDAERYRWLRDKSFSHCSHADTATLDNGRGIKVTFELFGGRIKPTVTLYGSDLDATIDSVIAAVNTEPGEEG
jgi:hypothetical protein